MNRLSPNLAGIESCTGCMGCIEVCPVKAISKTVNTEGHYVVTVDKEKCIGCLKCQYFCENSKKSYGSLNLRLSSVYAGWANNVEIRDKATSGGIFGAIATAFIEHGGAVVGAAFNGYKCEHIIVENTKKLPQLQGSKYTQSDMAGIFGSISSIISEKPVLFSGTGCQCAAIRAYFKDNKYFENLYLIDLVCGGVPSNFLIEKYYEANPHVNNILSFRNKNKYELTIQTSNGINYDDKGLPIVGFAYENTNRYSCYNCHFSYPHRKADLTIGDIWGNDDFEKEKGVSLIICHNTRGSTLLELADATLETISWEPILRGNRRIIYGKSHISSLRKKMGKNFREKPYEYLQRYYGMVFSSINPIGIGLKIIRKIFYIVDKIRADRLISKALKGEFDE